MTPEQIAEAHRLVNNLRNLYFEATKVGLAKAEDELTLYVPNVSGSMGGYSQKWRLSDAMRQSCFRQWKRQKVLAYNEGVRKLNQWGVKHDFVLLPLPIA